MIAHFEVAEKSFGSKVLYRGLDMRLAAGEKVGLIGRNGTGKSTLLNIIAGTDKDYDGSIHIKKGMVLIASRQEHHGHENQTVLDYITADLPEFTKLKHIIDTYPTHMGDSNTKLQVYSDALDHFGQLGYYEIESQIKVMLEDYQIDEDTAHGLLGDLSGGQKRMVELVKVQRANAHIALIDEPTNHMDYVAKASFVNWMKSTNDAVLVITHDRDVLSVVDKIVEIRDGIAEEFKGNYDAYLKINSNRMSSQVNEYAITQRRIDNLRTSVIRFRRLKEKARDPGTIAQFKRLELISKTELEELTAREKPSFWIDQESTKQLNTKLSNAYDKHKAKNIKIDTRSKSEGSERKLISVLDLSLGYDNPLFKDVSFDIREGEKLELNGRNGVGKSTIVKAILATARAQKLESKVYDGEIEIEPSVMIGVYEQELDEKFLDQTLSGAIERSYQAKNLPISEQKIKQLLGDYLFDVQADIDTPVTKLSGGQKARLQIMSMLAGNPNMLILDEPTNHLDLPSIEELESALTKYTGAILYISHDSYFTSKIGGKVVKL